VTSVAVVGPGAIGSTVAAWLAQDDRLDVTLCARTPVEHLEIETPEGMIRATLPVLTDPGIASPVDWVILAVKAYDVDAASPWLTRLVGQGTQVAVLQNGVEHLERVSPYVPLERILPGVVTSRRSAYRQGTSVSAAPEPSSCPAGLRGGHSSICSSTR
jgi:2-dehydropantoate 2-reductase